MVVGSLQESWVATVDIGNAESATEESEVLKTLINEEKMTRQRAVPQTAATFLVSFKTLIGPELVQTAERAAKHVIQCQVKSCGAVEYCRSSRSSS